ncbi:hypothetical protein L873DRAFT_558713 [Choiromyces venosus 120613-1]|uniref:Uncharacterized protein n=1 Tax=Choiromyces venosus 120613-1 TaxID=1336337 RepID=A0A3N4K5Q1_9PEZI|nr:hypothetical protein L873DRAFT_558713 [Choiromyces venosus 120613-1]
MESILILQPFRCEIKQTPIGMLDILYCPENINSTMSYNLIILPVSTKLIKLLNVQHLCNSNCQPLFSGNARQQE